jgi:hypothetical protein
MSSLNQFTDRHEHELGRSACRFRSSMGAACVALATTPEGLCAAHRSITTAQPVDQHRSHSRAPQRQCDLFADCAPDPAIAHPVVPYYGRQDEYQRLRR